MSREKRAARLDALTVQFHRLLTGDRAKKIAFLYGAFEIGPAGWQAVADAITRDPRVLEVKMSSTYLRGHESKAVYQRGTDTFYFGSFAKLEKPLDQAVALHEAVHALQDRQKIQVPVLASEAAGFIAEVWYCLEAEVTPSVDIGRGIKRIATALRATGGRPAVSQEDQRTAEAEVIAMGYHPSKHFAGDGWMRDAPPPAP